MLFFFFFVLWQAAVALAASQFAGVNIAGFDFGADIQGKQNISSSFGPVVAIGRGNSDGAAQMQHFVQQDGLNMFRLPVTWQFLINSNSLNGTPVTNVSPGARPTSDGTLDPTNAAQYDQLVRSCLATGSTCIVDVHNYARFEGQVIGQGGPTDAQFAGLWAQLATLYRDEPRVVFGVMNEPHDLPSLPRWADTVQAAVAAIRGAGATSQTILLPGTDFTHAQTYVANGSAGNLSRVANPDGSTAGLVFDVHQYLDADGSGTHAECVADRVADAFEPLARFLRAAGRQAMLTEIGGGNTASCIKDLCSTLAAVNANADVYLGYTAWSAGGFATDYELAMTPFGSPGNFTDQETVRQCVVGTRGAAAGASNNNNTTAKATAPGAVTLAVSTSPAPMASLPAASDESQQADQPKTVTAGSRRLAVGAALGLVGLTAFAVL